MNYDFASLQVSQIARLANCETHKLHNISHFSLLARLARLALIFSREASLIFHKILARKIAKRDSPSTLPGRLSRRVGDQTVSPAFKHGLLLYKLGNIVWGRHVTCSKIFEYSLSTRKWLARNSSHHYSRYWHDCPGRVLAGVICDSEHLHPMTITFLATAGAAVHTFLLAR